MGFLQTSHFKLRTSFYLLLFGMVSGLACSEPFDSDAQPQSGKTAVYTYRILNTYPHDPAAFTQGLVVEDSVFYEGTGLNGQSTLRRVRITSGTVEDSHALSPILFGEGIALLGDRIVQLTWQSRMGFVYDKYTLEPVRTFVYPTEGWGITYDGHRLVMSDGSATLYFRDPVTFEETGRVAVTDGDRPVERLNELEWVRGEVFANVWQTDRIARIDPTNGKVTGWIDLTGLLATEDRATTVDVLNGIAYDATRNRLFVTGKLWPKVFEIELVPKESP